MVKFIFDLDGTVTRQETLPLLARSFGIEEEISPLTKETVEGRIPFVESFIRRVHILGKCPVKQVNKLLADIKLYPTIAHFIVNHKDSCCIATGNLDCWVDGLLNRLSCEYYCSSALVENDKVSKLVSILKKEDVVRRYQGQGYKVVFIGDGNNDVDAMRLADVAIASGITHYPAPGAISVADYLVVSEEALCRQLNQLL